MNRKDPFLVLPDFRENLVCELLLGNPLVGPIPDTSGNGNNGVITNAVRITDSILGKKVLDFSAAGSKVVIPDVDELDLDSNSGSVVLIVRPTTDGDKIYSRSYNFDIGIQASGSNLTLYTYNGETGVELYGGASFPTDTWAMIAFVKDYVNSKVYIYLNGVLTDSANEERGYVRSKDVALGVHADGTPMQGNILLFRQYYNLALSVLQIKQIYQYARRYYMGISPKA